MVSRDELMSINEAVEQYGHSKPWWFDQIKAGRLTVYDVPGDRQSFLSRKEVAAFMEPKARPRTADSEAM